MLRERLSYAVVPLAALLISLGAVDLPYYAEGPGPARDVIPLISVDGHQVFASDGHFILTSVTIAPLNVFHLIGAALDPAKKVIPESFIIAPGQSRQQADQVAVAQMDQSQVDAAATVLAKLTDYPRDHGPGVLVEAVGGDCPAAGHLAPGHVITAVNGQRLASVQAFDRILKGIPASRPLTLTVQARDETFTTRLTRRPCSGFDQPIIGIAPLPNFPFRITVSLSDVGGPSAGLMFALGLYDLLTPGDLTGGRIVAGTGTIDGPCMCAQQLGVIGPIGGIEEKVAAARQAGADVFLVPAGQNFEGAKAVAGDLTLVPVKTFGQALRYLLRHGGGGDTTASPSPSPAGSASPSTTASTTPSTTPS